jgi:SpoVK/Ycf46/Vps4 family AAA+-type ATPase
LVRRRLVKRIYIPLPDEATRRAVLRHLLQDVDKCVQGSALHCFVHRALGVRATGGLMPPACA